MKLPMHCGYVTDEDQPPSGGCVLKRNKIGELMLVVEPAAFRRLCVETLRPQRVVRLTLVPAAFRRLCVETNRQHRRRRPQGSSRLQAAVC